MIDIKMTDTGDIDCFYERPLFEMKISFTAGALCAQKISFMLSSTENTNHPSGLQKIYFRYDDLLGGREIISENQFDIEEAIQAIKIKLRTEFGDTPNYDLGSDLYKQLHTVYKSESSLNTIRSIISSVVSEFLPDATVTLQYGKGSTDDYFSIQTVAVTISYDDSVLAQFDLI